MAITLSIIPTETRVRSGQPVNFMLSVANTDGATRTIVWDGAQSDSTIAPSALAATITPLVPSVSVANSATGYIPFRGVFFASAPAPADSDGSVVAFKLNLHAENTSGAITSNEQSAVCDMTVIYEGNTISNFAVSADGQLDFSAFQNAILYQLHFV